jgi:AmmeMemoRadiSam system protein B
MIEKPRIRPLEAFPVEHNGERMVCLRDPSGAAPEPIAIGIGAYYLITMFDGTRNLLDLQAAFARQFGEILPAEKLAELVTALDQGYFLDSPAYERRVRQMREEFAARPERPAAHAGLCYRDDPAALRIELGEYYTKVGSVQSDPDTSGPIGLIAPHIDPRRGGAAYARAYAQLAAASARPELVIILGTSHYGAGPQLFTATLKDYATPLGAVRTDREFVERLQSRYRAGDLFADELLHRNEHSIEFQALFLAHALGVDNYRIVPILVSSFHQMLARGDRPSSERRVGEFIEALGAAIAAQRRHVLVIAGVDFGHIGRKFGDDFGVDDGKTAELRAADRRLIDHIERVDAAGFFGEIAQERDRWRICGLAPIYTQLELLGGRRARLLDYDIAMEPPTQSAVSFASLAIY